MGRQVSEAVACSRLAEVQELAMKYGVIGIDEGQFVRRLLFRMIVELLLASLPSVPRQGPCGGGEGLPSLGLEGLLVGVFGMVLPSGC